MPPCARTPTFLQGFLDNLVGVFEVCQHGPFPKRLERHVPSCRIRLPESVARPLVTSHGGVHEVGTLARAALCVCKLARAHQALVILALAGTGLSIIYYFTTYYLNCLLQKEAPYHTCQTSGKHNTSLPHTYSARHPHPHPSRLTDAHRSGKREASKPVGAGT